MKQTNALLCLGLLTLLVSCGDVSSNHQQGTNQERTIPGVEGSSGADGQRSQIHREKGTTVISYADEILKTFSNDLSVLNYRVIPEMEKDSEGGAENVRTVSQMGRPSVNCGETDSFAGIDARITDCFQKNGEKALWEGFRWGAAGEGTWKLVTLNSSVEIWFDGRSGMVWSEVKGGTNWCKASGNEQDNTNLGGVDCNTLANKESVCVNSSTTGIGSQIKWRLPTRNDFLQADLNGMRFVLRKEEATLGLWTATMVSGITGRNQAWIYNSAKGTLTTDQLSSSHAVRCIGTPDR